MATILEFLLSDTGQRIALWVLSALGTWLAGQRWLTDYQTGVARKITAAIESAALTTYDEVVRTWKLQSGDGKLTSEQRAEAYARTVESAKGILARQGIDLVKRLSPELVKLGVETAVQKLKRPNVKVQLLPVATRELVPDEVK